MLKLRVIHHSAFQKFGPKGVKPNRLMPAYGLAENTLFVSGRQIFESEVKIIRVNADRMRAEGIVEIISEEEYEKTVKLDGANSSTYQKLVGSGPCGEMVDGETLK